MVTVAAASEVAGLSAIPWSPAFEATEPVPDRVALALTTAIDTVASTG
jgi:hypothetical protein